MKAIEYGFTAEQIIKEGRVTEDDINEIQEWLPTANLIELTREQIVGFLLSCCNQIEPTKKTIIAGLTLATEIPEVTANRTLEREELRKHLEMLEFCICPERSPDGCLIVLARLHDTNYRNLDMTNTLTLLSMVLEAALYDYPPTGLIVIGDMRGVGLMHMTKIKLRLTRIFFQILQEALPVQMKQVHVINTVSFLDKLLTIVKPFVRKEVMGAVHFHPTNTDMDEFAEKWIPKRYLPKDYGGDLPPVSELHQRTIEKLKQLEPIFKQEEMQTQSLLQKKLIKK